MKLTEEIPLEVSVFRSQIDGRLVVSILTAGLEDPDDNIRIELNDGLIWRGSPERPNEIKPVVLMRDGETFEGNDVDVIDVTAIFQSRRGASEWSDDDVTAIIRRLQDAGWEETAGDVIEHWFGEAGVPR